MKMVKSLLLGSAAGLVAITAGQAADLPVKAKPVEYVKICSLYGAGFYYMPGTDLCIKVGGWARAEITEGGNGSLAWGAYNANTNSRGTNNLTTRERAYITTDIRNQTEYGTIRAYIAEGISSNDTGMGASEGSNTFSANRAFVQWAGLTAGLSQSFYDFFSGPAASYRAGYLGNSDTGDAGWFVWAYTAQLGGGFSATLSAEQRRMSQIIQNSAAGVANAGSIADRLAPQAPARASATAACRTWTTSPTSGSIKPGAARRSWVRPIGQCSVLWRHDGNGSSGRRLGLRSWCWSEAQFADDHTGRLVPDAGQLFARCNQVPQQRR